MDKIKTILLKFIPPIILLIGIFAVIVMIEFKPAPRQVPEPSKVKNVTIVYPETVNYIPAIVTYGDIYPVESTKLTSKISGFVTTISSVFDTGKVFKKGDILFTLDDSDYKAALESANARVASARLLLAKEKAEMEVAKKELDLIVPDKKDRTALASRELQLNQARSEYQAALASLESASFNLKNTTFKVPYEGRVKSRSIGLGQFVSPGVILGEIFSTDNYELKLPVTENELSILGISADYIANDTNQIMAEIVPTEIENKDQPNDKCKIVRTDGILDPKTRLINLICKIDPKSTVDTRIIPGTFVKATVHGNVKTGYLKLPIEALREGNKVYILDSDNNLKILAIEPFHTTEESLIIRSGLSGSDKIIVSYLDPEYSKGLTFNEVLLNQSGKPEENSANDNEKEIMIDATDEKPKIDFSKIKPPVTTDMDLKEPDYETPVIDLRDADKAIPVPKGSLLPPSTNNDADSSNYPSDNHENEPDSNFMDNENQDDQPEHEPFTTDDYPQPEKEPFTTDDYPQPEYDSIK